MRNVITILRQYIISWFKHFWRFSLVGMGGGVIDFGSYFLLTRYSSWWWQHFVLASTLTSLAAATNNFLWNRHWTFKSLGRGAWRQYVEYLFFDAVYIGMIQVSLWALVKFWHWNDLVAKFLSFAFIGAIFFTLVRHIVFRIPLKHRAVEKNPPVGYTGTASPDA